MTAPIGVFVMLLIFVFAIGAVTGAILLSLWWARKIANPRAARAMLYQAYRSAGRPKNLLSEGGTCPCCGWSEGFEDDFEDDFKDTEES